jgi:hypothetical protein
VRSATPNGQGTPSPPTASILFGILFLLMPRHLRSAWAATPNWMRTPEYLATGGLHTVYRDSRTRDRRIQDSFQRQTNWMRTPEYLEAGGLHTVYRGSELESNGLHSVCSDERTRRVRRSMLLAPSNPARLAPSMHACCLGK